MWFFDYRNVSSIDKNNKKLAYYESNKNASFDDLKRKLEAQLNAEDENQLICENFIKMVRFKIVLILLKQNTPILYHYFQIFFKTAPFKVEELEADERNISNI